MNSGKQPTNWMLGCFACLMAVAFALNAAGGALEEPLVGTPPDSSLYLWLLWGSAGTGLFALLFMATSVALFFRSSWGRPVLGGLLAAVVLALVFFTIVSSDMASYALSELLVPLGVSLVPLAALAVLLMKGWLRSVPAALLVALIPVLVILGRDSTDDTSKFFLGLLVVLSTLVVVVSPVALWHKKGWGRAALAGLLDVCVVLLVFGAILVAGDASYALFRLLGRLGVWLVPIACLLAVRVALYNGVVWRRRLQEEPEVGERSLETVNTGAEETS